jgi:hypothetical protein
MHADLGNLRWLILDETLIQGVRSVAILTLLYIGFEALNYAYIHFVG